MLRALRALLFLLIVTFPACGEGGESSSRAASDHTRSADELASYPLAYDSILLAEDERTYLGNPFNFVIERDVSGSMEGVWVSDFFANAVFGFGPDGDFQTRIGLPGHGPNELASAGSVFLDPSGQIGVTDRRNAVVKWFDRDLGEAVRLEPYGSGYGGITPPVPLGDDWSRLAFPVLDLEALTSVAILDTDSGAWTRTGTVPAGYPRSVQEGGAGFAAHFIFSLLAPLGPNDLLLGFQGSEILYRHRVGGDRSTPLGRIPRRVRKGADDDLWEAFEGAAQPGDPLPFEWASNMDEMGVLEDGRIAVVHVDRSYEGEPPSIVLTGTHYLTVLDPESDRACVDIPVPGGSDTRASFTIDGGLLYVLDRRITDAAAEPWLLILPIPSSGECPEAHRHEGWLYNPDGR